MDKYITILGLKYLFRKRLLYLLLFLPFISFSQITEVEYFIDTDPGFGNAKTLSMGEQPDPDNIILNPTIDLSGLSNGFHVLYVRAKGQYTYNQPSIEFNEETAMSELVYSPTILENWNIITSKPFLVVGTAITDAPSKILEIEYFIDNDPGFGNANPVTGFSSASDVTHNFTVDLSNISDGLHILYVRTKDANQEWSVLQSKPILVVGTSPTDPSPNITEIEYFLDTDPGFGNATQITGFSESSDVSQTFNVDLSGASNGLHILYARAKDANGQWSLLNAKPVLVVGTSSGDPNPDVEQIEYFIDTDPGFGNGVQVSGFSQSSDVSHIFNVDLSSVESGLHILYARSRDSNGSWSILNSKPILVVGTSPGDPTPDITQVEYFLDSDPGFGNGVQVTGFSQSPDVSQVFTVDLSSTTNGLHILYTRSKDANGQWSLLNAKPILVVGTSPGDPAPDITQLEYFIDADPGFGNGVQVTGFSQSSDVSHVFNVDLSGVNSGLHILYVRSKDANGSWSILNSKPILVVGTSPSDPAPFITELEYFIDTDPGIGNGKTIADFSPSDNVTHTFNVDLSEVDGGLHMLYVRSKDQNEQWSLPLARPILVVETSQSDPKPDITKIEYFFTNSTLEFTSPIYTVNIEAPATDIDTTFIADLSSLIAGESYVIHVYGVDENGQRSLWQTNEFEVVIPPLVISPSSDLTLDEDFEEFTIGLLDTIFTDPQGDVLTYSVLTPPNELISASVTDSTLTISAVEDANGTDTLFIVATDPSESIAIDTVIVNLNAINDEPEFEEVEDVEIDEDSDIISIEIGEISPGADDEDKQTLSFVVTSDNESLIPTPEISYEDGSEEANLSFTPNSDQSGTAIITVTLNDDGRGTSPNDSTFSQTFTVTVNPVNDQPVMIVEVDEIYFMEEDEGEQTINISGISDSQAGNEGQNLSIVATSSDNSIINDPVITYTSPEKNATLTFTPEPDQFGTVSISVTINDDGPGGSPNDSTFTFQFIVDIEPVDDDPTIDEVEDLEILEDAPTQNIVLTGITSGAANEDQQIYIEAFSSDTFLIKNPTISYNSPDETATLTFTPEPNQYGKDSIIVNVVTDIEVEGEGEFKFDHTLINQNNNNVNSLIIAVPGITSILFVVDVDSVNDAPGFTAGADQSHLEDGGVQSIESWATNINVGSENESDQSIVAFNVNNDNNSLFSVQPTIDVSGNLTYTLADNANGIANVTVSVSDDGGTDDDGEDTSADQFFIIDITAVNDAPSYTIGNNETVLEDSGPILISNWATDIVAGPADEGGQSLSFTLTNDNNSLFAVQPALDNSGTLTFTPADDANGSVNISIILKDDGGLDNGGVDSTTVQTFTITVNPVNDSPGFTKGEDQTVLEDAGVQMISGWATDISVGPTNESSQTITAFNVINDNSSLFSDEPKIDASGNLTFTPADDANGTATVTVSLTDDGGTDNGGVDTSGDQTFEITVTAVNDAPSFTMGIGQTVLEDVGPQTISNWATDINSGPLNENSQSLNFILTNDNNSLFSTQPSVDISGTLTYTAADDANGSTTVSIVLKDDGGTENGGVDTTLVQTFTIEVTPINDVPSYTIGTNQIVLEDEGAQIVNNWATDISTGPSNESDQLITTFNVSNDNNSLFSVQPAVDISGNLTYTPADDANGIANITISVSDDGGTENSGIDTSSDEVFTITVTAVNDVPGFVKGDDQEVLEDAGVQTVNGWATDISTGPSNESSQLITSFNVSNDNNSLFSIQPAVDISGNLTYTPADDANGSATVSISITDNGGTENEGVDTSVEQTFIINITAVNDVPSFTKGSDQNLLEDPGPQLINGWATAISTGPSNESSQSIISFNVNNDNNGLFAVQPSIDVSGNLSYTLVENFNGSAIVTVSMTDDGGTENGGIDTTGEQTFTISVNSVNDAPSFTKGSDLLPFEDSGPQTINNWATDISVGPENENTQSIVSFNVSNNNNSLFSEQPEIDVDGNLTFTPADDIFGSAIVTVSLTDDGGTENGGIDTSDEQTFIINVASVNDNPTDISLSNNILDDQPIIGSIVGILAVDDIDTDDSHSFALNDNLTYPDNDLFIIEEDELKVNGVLSYINKISYIINLQVQDAGGLTFDKEFIINLNEPDVTEADSTALVDLFNELGDLLPWDLGDPVYTWEGVELAGDSTVRSLDISYSEITELNTEVLTGLEGLEYLDVSNNQLRFDDLEPLVQAFNSTAINFIYSPQEKIDNKKTVHILLDRGATLDVTSSSVNNQFQWTKNEVDINGENGQSLFIGSVTNSSAGRYSCKITNPLVPELELLRENIFLKVVIAMNEQDSIALENVFISLNVDEALYDTSDQGLASAWPGVTTFAGRITELDLSSFALNGSIPSDVGNMPELTKLVLFDNNISGSIPTEIGNLTKLEILDLDKNNLSGAIPPEIGQLTELTTLWLARNQLTSIPSELGNLTKLKNLFLHRNLITSIPISIQNLTDLDIFNISNNLITSVPDGLISLNKLKEFNINNNNLDSLPDNIDTMSSLEFLGVKRNNLDFEDLEVFDLVALENVVEYIPQNELIPDIDSIVLLGESYSIMSTVNGSDNAYLWRKNGDIISNTASSFKIASMSTSDVGVYTYEVTSPTLVPDLIIYSQKYTIGADCGDLLQAGISTENATVICAGSGAAITFNASPVSEGNSYKWLKDGVNIAALNSENFTAYETGFFQVEITDAEGCTDLSEGIEISEASAVNVSIEVVDTVLVATSDNDGSYQWFLNEVPIDEATDSVWLPLDPGNYNVAFSNNLGCITFSNIITVSVTGLVDQMFSKSIRIYPNPNNGEFSLSFEDNSIKGEAILNIRNALGKIVKEKKLLIDKNPFEIDIKDQPTGMYLIEIVTSKGQAIKRVIKK